MHEICTRIVSYPTQLEAFGGITQYFKIETSETYINRFADEMLTLFGDP